MNANPRSLNFLVFLLQLILQQKDLILKPTLGFFGSKKLQFHGIGGDREI